MKKFLEALANFLFIFVTACLITYSIKGIWQKPIEKENERLTSENILLRKQISELKEENKKLQELIELSKHYSELSRKLGGTHEVSILLVESITKNLSKHKDIDITVDDVLSVLLIESLYDPLAVSHAGAIGIGQIMPATARAYGMTDVSLLRKVDANVELAIAILVDYTKKLGDKRLGLLAYNRGITRVSSFLAQGKDPSNQYEKRVLETSGKRLGK